MQQVFRPPAGRPVFQLILYFYLILRYHPTEAFQKVSFINLLHGCPWKNITPASAFLFYPFQSTFFIFCYTSTTYYAMYMWVETQSLTPSMKNTDNARRSTQPIFIFS